MAYREVTQIYSDTESGESDMRSQLFWWDTTRSHDFFDHEFFDKGIFLTDLTGHHNIF